MPIVVTVQVSLEDALALHRQTTPGDAKDLLALVKRLGVDLEPIHPGARDPLLMPFFKIEVPDQAAAERVIVALSESKSVEGAYVKPPEALP